MRKLVLLSLLSFSPIALAQPASAPTATATAAGAGGHWEGSIELPGGQQLNVIVDLSQDAGAWNGSIDIPQQGATGLPLENVKVDGENVTFAIKGVPGAPTFTGRLTSAGIEGNMKQGNYDMPFELSREKSVTGALVRPQEPKPPLPYKETELVVPAGDHQIAGTLTLPQGAGPFAVVVMISDMGPQNRDGELFGHKPFKLLSDQLARAGMAALRYDDRGIGKSTGELLQASSEDLALDVQTCIAALKQRSEIAKDQIGLLGIGQGAFIAATAAAQSPDVKFLTLIAPAGINGEQLLSSQAAAALKAAGMPDAQIAQMQQDQFEVFTIIKETKDAADAEARLTETLGQIYDRQPAMMQGVLGKKEEFIKTQLQQVNTPSIRSLILQDPLPVLRKIRQPVLALWGALDQQIDPQQNAGEVESALREADNQRITVKTLDGLNHMLQPAKTGELMEVNEIETTMDEGALKIIVEWVKQNCAN